MSLDQIAKDYVAFVEAGQFLEVFDALYAEDAISVEAMEPPGGGAGRVASGLDALRAKNKAFDSQHEVHAPKVHGVWPHGDDRFAVRMTFDITHIESGHQRTADERVVLTVSDGKIVREEFFYGE